jgi:hypothetical protein
VGGDDEEPTCALAAAVKSSARVAEEGWALVLVAAKLVLVAAKRWYTGAGSYTGGSANAISSSPALGSTHRSRVSDPTGGSEVVTWGDRQPDRSRLKFHPQARRRHAVRK